MADFILIGRLGPQSGTNGFIKFIPLSDFPERFYSLLEVYLDFWGDKKKFLVEKVESHKKSLYIKFRNFSTEREIELLSGREVYVVKEDVVELPENYFFIHDLVGCKVLSGTEIIGVIREVLKLPSSDVLEIVDHDNKEILIPFVGEFIEKFEPEQKVLILKQGVDLNYDKD